MKVVLMIFCARDEHIAISSLQKRSIFWVFSAIFTSLNIKATHSFPFIRYLCTRKNLSVRIEWFMKT